MLNLRFLRLGGQRAKVIGAERLDVANGCVVTAIAVLFICYALVIAAPLNTDDLWWHLKAGEMYFVEGLWPSADWMLHTAHDEAPVQHEWLFGVLVHCVNTQTGFYGLRALHVVAVFGSFVCVWLVTRRGVLSSEGIRGLRPLLAGGAVVAFGVLASPRLAQLRPDLITIPATLGVYWLLHHRDGPSLRVAVGTAALFLLWSNLHSLVLIGINLIVAAMLGAWLAGGLRLGFGLPADPESRTRQRGWLLMLAAGMAMAMVNPRGADQLITFLTTTRETAAWFITDEWAPFNPLLFRSGNPAVETVPWLVANAVLATFFITSMGLVISFFRVRTGVALARFDPVGFGLGLAGVVAMLISVRFLWMGILPLLYVLSKIDIAARHTVLRSLLGGMVLAVVVFFTQSHFTVNTVVRFWDRPHEYVDMPFRHHQYFSEGVDFLRRSGIEGRLFNVYWMGGFLGYWTAPKLKTFVDGRTEHYSMRTYIDYSSVLQMKGGLRGESYLDVLDRNGVDVFFGVGFPGWWYGINTTTHLENIPGWVLVARSYRLGIYLRSGSEQLEHVAAFYAKQGIPFSKTTGLEVNQIIQQFPTWAVAQTLLPVDYPHLLATTQSLGDTTLVARDRLGLVYCLSGAYKLQVALDQETVGRFPAEHDVARRLIYGLLKLGRVAEAEQEAIRLARVAPKLGRAAKVLILAYSKVRDLNVATGQVRTKRALINQLLVPAFPFRADRIWRLEYSMRTEQLFRPD